MLRKAGYTAALNEPTAILATPRTGDSVWLVSLPDPACGKTYGLDFHPPFGHYAPYGPAKLHARFATARAAHLKQ